MQNAQYTMQNAKCMHVDIALAPVPKQGAGTSYEVAFAYLNLPAVQSSLWPWPHH